MEYDPHQLIEGCAICCYAVAAPHACYIYIRGEYTKARRDPRAGDRGGLRRRASSATTCWARASSWTCTSTAAPAPTSAARRPACSSRWRASAASRGSSRPSPPSSAPSARRPSINNVETLANVPHIIDARRRLVQGDRHRRAEHRPQALRHLRPRRAPGHLRVPDRRHLPRACSTAAAACSRGGRSRRSSPAAPRRRSCTADQIDIKMDFDTRRQGRLDARLGGGDRDGRHHLHGARRWRASRSSSTTNRAASARRAARGRTGWS